MNAGVFAALVSSVAISCGALVSQDSGVSSNAEPASPYVLSHDANRIDGTPQPLKEYEGNVVLIVNTASKCGLTPQYEGLESLYREKKDEGFVILGFPANNFFGQEPGSNEEIAEFCSERFDVTFPMFEKIDVKGDDTHPLYGHLAELSEKPSWNFTKYLVDREGNFVQRFGPRTSPGDDDLVEKIDELLAAPMPEKASSE
jgi:glutathione peroxidase